MRAACTRPAWHHPCAKESRTCPGRDVRRCRSATFRRRPGAHPVLEAAAAGVASIGRPVRRCRPPPFGLCSISGALVQPVSSQCARMGAPRRTPYGVTTSRGRDHPRVGVLRTGRPPELLAVLQRKGDGFRALFSRPMGIVHEPLAALRRRSLVSAPRAGREVPGLPRYRQRRSASCP